MNWSFRLDVKFLLFSLSVLVFDPLRCAMPKADLLAAEIPAPIMITEGKTTQGFPYLAGGVSSNEREIFVERGRGFNLKLSFADRRGPYVADVELVIEAAKGVEIIRMKVDGPLFFIQLPDGDYAVKATFNRETKRVNVKLRKDKGVHYTLLWNLRDPSEGGGVR
jgi:hypothetical protein